MALFDGGRWDRIRHWKAGAYHDFGPLRIGAEANMHEAPLPRISITREDGEVGLVLSIGDAWNDRFAEAHATLVLPLWLRWLAPTRPGVTIDEYPQAFETEPVIGGARG